MCCQTSSPVIATKTEASDDASILHRFYDSFVQRAVGDNDAAILSQLVPLSKIEWFAVNVGYCSASFLNDQNTTRVIPDFLLVRLTRRQPKINVSLPSRNNRVLRLTVQTNRFFYYSQ
jgi:hypothetical protein